MSIASEMGNGIGEPSDAESGEVYLVVREGPTWHDIFRLLPGSVVTVGRDPGNRIVLRDDRCSRRHCSLLQDGSTWTIRDLGSRNGTIVNGAKIDETAPLEEGALIVIGTTELLFTSDISRPLDRPPPEDPLPARETSPLEVAEESGAGPLILERKSKAHFAVESTPGPERVGRGGVRETFATLYRLIVRMMSSTSCKDVCETVLEALLPAIGADIGAALLFPERAADRTDPGQLRIVAYRAPHHSPYRRVSTKLSTLALEEQEAVLAGGISDDPERAEFGTLCGMAANSVICAPIRSGDRVHGLLHLYSLQPDHALDADALELVLAVGDHLAIILENLDEKESLATSLRRARDQNSSLRQLLEIESDLIGESLPMRELRDTIARVAPSDATILVRGESGVGKELVARAIHFNSNRRKGPFICVNCAALTETLLESELFGHEKGAFTGAVDRKPGRFEQAHQGTLFLDEVGEMPVSTQAKLLRVLEGHPFERVGGSESVEVDVRVVAATNRDLESAVEEADFRKDLLYRLQVIEIRVPPLAEHADDVPLLAEHLLDRACARLGRGRMEFSPSATQRLCRHAWPGNVRELRNVVERAVVLADGPEITEEDLRFTSLPPAESSPSPPAAPAPTTPAPTTPAPTESAPEAQDSASLEEVERLHIMRVIESTNWKKRETARILGINRSTLDRKLQKYAIRPPEPPDDW